MRVIHKLSGAVIVAALLGTLGGVSTAAAAGEAHKVPSGPGAIETQDSRAPLPTERISGTDRYNTSIEISKKGFPDTTAIVFLAAGDDYPDALSAAPAAATTGGPLLLTPSDRLLDETVAEIQRLQPDAIVVVGGEQAISAGVETELQQLAGVVLRIAGTDRFDTSRQIASMVFDTSKYAYIATGQNFPDALSAGAVAGYDTAPIILVDGNARELDTATKQLIHNLGVQLAVVVGGPAAVSNDLVASVSGVTAAIRIAGNDRFETSSNLNYWAFDDIPTAYLSTGSDFPDALAGAALAGYNGAPLYVVQDNCIPTQTLDDFDAFETQDLVLIGGTSVLGDGVRDQVPC